MNKTKFSIYCLLFTLVLCSVHSAWAQQPTKVTEQKLYYVGKKAFEDGLNDLAIQQLGSFVKEYPQSLWAASAHFMLAEGLFRQKKYQQAAAAYEEITHRHPKESWLDKVWFRRGECFFVLKEWDKAALVWGEFKFPESKLLKQVLFYQGEALYQQEKYAQAIKPYQQLEKKFPQNTNNDLLFLRLAWCYYKENDLNQAAHYFKLLAGNSKSKFALDAQWQLAGCFFRLKDYKEAGAEYLKFIQRHPKSKYSSQAYYYRSQAAWLSKDYSLAASAISQLLKAYPDYEDKEQLYLQLAQSYGHLKDEEAALVSYQKLLVHYPKSKYVPDVLYNQGVLYLNSKQSAKARSQFERLVKEFPQYNLTPAVNLQLGNLAFQEEHWSQAADYYKSLDTAEAQYRLGECYWNQKQMKEAQKFYLNLVEQNPKSEAWINLARLRLGQIYEQEGKSSQAQRVYEDILSQTEDEQLKKIAEKQLKQLFSFKANKRSKKEKGE